MGCGQICRFLLVFGSFLTSRRICITAEVVGAQRQGNPPLFNTAIVMKHGGSVKLMLRVDLYFLSFARDRFTLSSYSDEGIQKRVEKWAGGVPALR